MGVMVMNREKNIKRIQKLKNILETDIDCEIVLEYFNLHDELKMVHGFREKRKKLKEIKKQSSGYLAFDKYFRIKGEIRIREIIRDCYYGNDDLNDTDKEILRNYFYYSNYSLYSKSGYDSSDVATYSGEFDDEDVEILKKLYRRFDSVTDLDKNELVIDKIDQELSCNKVSDIASKVLELEEKVNSCTNPIKKLALKKIIWLYKRIILFQSEEYGKYLRLHHELELRYLIRKYNNQEALTRDELSYIRFYLDILDLQRKYPGVREDEYGLRLNDEDIILLKKISDRDKKSS